MRLVLKPYLRVGHIEIADLPGLDLFKEYREY